MGFFGSFGFGPVGSKAEAYTGLPAIRPHVRLPARLLRDLNSRHARERVNLVTDHRLMGVRYRRLSRLVGDAELGNLGISKGVHEVWMECKAAGANRGICCLPWMPRKIGQETTVMNIFEE
ncbi:hypothetical protein KM043_005700 [Ampulex compressa]|nr:hypothetical protein KM043_005700 [Ampulex compressa]